MGKLDRSTEKQLRATFVFLAALLLINGLFGKDITEQKGLIVVNGVTRLLILSFLYSFPD